jgi:hypothetical protein
MPLKGAEAVPGAWWENPTMDGAWRAAQVCVGPGTAGRDGGNLRASHVMGREKPREAGKGTQPASLATSVR